MAKPNYRQQKKQKEQARLTRQAEKLKRRAVKTDDPDPNPMASGELPANPAVNTTDSA